MKDYLPGQNYILSDDVEVMQLCNDLGVIDKVRPSSGCNTTYIKMDMKSHYALLSYHKDHELEKDNGFAAILLSKWLFTKEQAHEFFSDVIVNTSEKQVFGGEIVQNQHNQ